MDRDLLRIAKTARERHFYRMHGVDALARFFSRYSFTDWAQGMGDVMDRGLRPESWADPDREMRAYRKNPVRHHILWTGEAYEFGFPAVDPLHLFRALLDLVSGDAGVVLDYSSLVEGGYVAPRTEVAVEVPRFILLTEGKTDAEFILGSLKYRRPHLADYFTVLDFPHAKPMGSAGSLVNAMKLITAAGLTDRFIALFDNDAAATEALRGLRDLPLPGNIRIIRIPAFRWARRYPLLRDGALARGNINGHAVSMELCFGRDLLQQRTGYIPVRWSAILPGCKQWHGNLENKPSLQSSFRQLLASPGAVPHDWAPMDTLLNRVTSAFRRTSPGLHGFSLRA